MLWDDQPVVPTNRYLAYLQAFLIYRLSQEIPFWENTRLLNQTVNLMWSSIKFTTRSTYLSGLNSFFEFVGKRSLEVSQVLPITGPLLLGYITEKTLVTKVSYKTLRVYVAALKFFHRQYGLSDLGFESPLVALQMRAARRESAMSSRKERLPITLPLLKCMIEKLDERKNVRDETRLHDRALLMFGFQSGIRPSVYVSRTLDQGTPVFDPLRWKHVTFRTGSVTVLVEASKTDQFRVGREVNIYRTGGFICAVTALEALKANSDKLGRGSGSDPVFVKRSGVQTTYSDLGKLVKLGFGMTGYDPGLLAVTSYSLRRGLVTSAMLAGLPVEAVKALTGHLSDAWKNYVRITEELWRGYAAQLVKNENHKQMFGWLGAVRAQEAVAADVDAFYAKHEAERNRAKGEWIHSRA